MNRLCTSLLFVVLIPHLPQAAFSFFDPTVRENLPQKISETGLFSDIKTKQITPEAFPFAVNSPLWSDGAVKSRYVIVPPGTQIVYSDTSDIYEYPDGTYFIKNFLVELTPGDESALLWIETRFTIRQTVDEQTRWFTYSYRWDQDQSDATLVEQNGADASVPLVSGKTLKWRFPSQEECAECHRVHSVGGVPGRAVLGFLTAQINRGTQANPSKNQILDFFEKNLFSGTPPDVEKSPRWVPPDHPSAPLEIRARSYLGANCSGCHGSRGNASGAVFGPQLNFDFHQMEAMQDVRGVDAQHEYGLPEFPKVIWPGRPEVSILLYRQVVRNHLVNDFLPELDQMPPLGVFQRDSVALHMLWEWILKMEPDPDKTTEIALEVKNSEEQSKIQWEWMGAKPVNTNHIHPTQGRLTNTGDLRFFRNGRFWVPEPLRSSQIYLLNSLGRRHEVIAVGEGYYQILKSGGSHYLSVIVGNHTFPYPIFIEN